MAIHHRLLMLGICKDSATALPGTLTMLERTGALFDDYRILIYENNSEDDTPEILSNFENLNRRVRVLSEHLTTEQLDAIASVKSWDGNPCRVEMIAYARNRLLDQLESPEYAAFDYVMMIDLDLNEWSLDGIEDSFSRPEEWDAITSNGINQDGVYVDAYAYRDREFPFGPELLGEYWWERVAPRLQKRLKGTDLIPVYSAFGGLGFYRRAAVSEARYSGVVTADLHRLNVNLIRGNLIDEKWMRALKQVSTYPRGSVRTTELFGDGVPYIDNSGYPYPVTIDHQPFYASMIARGHCNIYVNPLLTIAADPTNCKGLGISRKPAIVIGITLDAARDHRVPRELWAAARLTLSRKPFRRFLKNFRSYLCPNTTSRHDQPA